MTNFRITNKCEMNLFAIVFLSVLGLSEANLRLARSVHEVALQRMKR